MCYSQKVFFFLEKKQQNIQNLLCNLIGEYSVQIQCIQSAKCLGKVVQVEYRHIAVCGGSYIQIVS